MVLSPWWHQLALVSLVFSRCIAEPGCSEPELHEDVDLIQGVSTGASLDSITSGDAQQGCICKLDGQCVDAKIKNIQKTWNTCKNKVLCTWLKKEKGHDGPIRKVLKKKSAVICPGKEQKGFSTKAMTKMSTKVKAPSKNLKKATACKCQVKRKSSGQEAECLDSKIERFLGLWKECKADFLCNYLRREDGDLASSDEVLRKDHHKVCTGTGAGVKMQEEAIETVVTLASLCEKVVNKYDALKEGDKVGTYSVFKKYPQKGWLRGTVLFYRARTENDPHPQAVIALKGSEGTFAHIKKVVEKEGSTKAELEEAQKVFKVARAKAGPNRVLVIGHGLGGFLAEILATHRGLPGLAFNAMGPIGWTGNENGNEVNPHFSILNAWNDSWFGSSTEIGKHCNEALTVKTDTSHKMEAMLEALKTLEASKQDKILPPITNANVQELGQPVGAKRVLA